MNNTRTAFLSDIHGNSAALKKCIEILKERRVESIVFLGDYVGYFPYPEKVMELIYEIRESGDFFCRFIRGNGDEYYIAHRKDSSIPWAYNGISSGTLQYTYDHLTQKDIDFFAGLGIFGKYIGKESVPYTYCHGSPDSTKQKLFPFTQITDNVLDNLDFDILICAHTHTPCIYRHKDRLLINSGSVGLAWNSGAMATFALLDTDNKAVRNVEIVYVDYCKNGIVEDFYSSDLIHTGRVDARMNLYQLLHGVNIWDPCVELAAKFYRQEKGTEPDNGVPPENFIELAFNNVCGNAF